MGNIFFRKPTVTEVDRAILDLKTTRRKLTQYQQQFEKVIEAEKQAARDLIKENRKDRALLALKKKKTWEEILKKVYDFLYNVDRQLTDIELASKQKMVLESLKTGNNAIKEILGQISLVDVMKLKDNSDEAKSYQDEINAILGDNLSPENKEEVEAELANLEIELTLQSLPNVALLSAQAKTEELAQIETEDDMDLELPDVPSTTPVLADNGSEAISNATRERTKVLEEPQPA